MDILGVGFPELVFIMIIALMVFGPRRLPEMAAKAGKIVADLRNMSQGMMAEWQREIKASEIQEELRKTRQEFTQARSSLADAGKSVSKQTADVVNSIAPPQIASAASSAQKEANPNPAAPETSPTPPENGDSAGAADNQPVKPVANQPAQNSPEPVPETGKPNNSSSSPSPVSSAGSEKAVNEQ